MNKDRQHAPANPAKAANELAPFAELAEGCEPAPFMPLCQGRHSMTILATMGFSDG